MLGAAFLTEAHLLRRRIAAGSADVTATAMRLFHGSITYLALLFLLVRPQGLFGEKIIDRV